jgi:hypothetical protein
MVDLTTWTVAQLIDLFEPGAGLVMVWKEERALVFQLLTEVLDKILDAAMFYYEEGEGSPILRGRHFEQRDELIASIGTTRQRLSAIVAASGIGDEPAASPRVEEEASDA